MIDNQHRELLILANHLVELSLASLAQEVTQEKVEAQLDRLLEHLVYHFEQERQVLVGIGYPEAIHHAEVQKALTAKVLQFRVRYQQGELRASAFYSFIIDDVVMGHMLRDDVLFFPYTAQKLN